MDAERLTESVKFLLRSVRQLSDRFVETTDNTMRSFERVRTDVSDIADRLDRLDIELQNWRDQELVASDESRRSLDLPARADQQDRVIPALNLPIEGILDAYRTTPVLLQPFSRACSVSGRTLSGQIDEIELEVFAQGSSWMIETQDGDWLLLPRPGILQRQTQLDSLNRLFDIREEAALPAELELIKPGYATVVEYGRRWYLKSKGEIGIQPDPLKKSLERRIQILEEKMNVNS